MARTGLSELVHLWWASLYQACKMSLIFLALLTTFVSTQSGFVHPGIVAMAFGGLWVAIIRGKSRWGLHAYGIYLFVLYVYETSLLTTAMLLVAVAVEFLTVAAPTWAKMAEISALPGVIINDEDMMDTKVAAIRSSPLREDALDVEHALDPDDDDECPGLKPMHRSSNQHGRGRSMAGERYQGTLHKLDVMTQLGYTEDDRYEIGMSKRDMRKNIGGQRLLFNWKDRATFDRTRSGSYNPKGYKVISLRDVGSLLNEDQFTDVLSSGAMVNMYCDKITEPARQGYVGENGVQNLNSTRFVLSKRIWEFFGVDHFYAHAVWAVHQETTVVYRWFLRRKTTAVVAVLASLLAIWSAVMTAEGFQPTYAVSFLFLTDSVCLGRAWVDLPEAYGFSVRLPVPAIRDCTSGDYFFTACSLLLVAAAMWCVALETTVLKNVVVHAKDSAKQTIWYIPKRRYGLLGTILLWHAHGEAEFLHRLEPTIIPIKEKKIVEGEVTFTNQNFLLIKTLKDSVTSVDPKTRDVTVHRGITVYSWCRAGSHSSMSCSTQDWEGTITRLINAPSKTHPAIMTAMLRNHALGTPKALSLADTLMFDSLITMLKSYGNIDEDGVTTVYDHIFVSEDVQVYYRDPCSAMHFAIAPGNSNVRKFMNPIAGEMTTPAKTAANCAVAGRERITNVKTTVRTATAGVQASMDEFCGFLVEEIGECGGSSADDVIAKQNRPTQQKILAEACLTGDGFAFRGPELPEQAETFGGMTEDEFAAWPEVDRYNDGIKREVFRAFLKVENYSIPENGFGDGVGENAPKDPRLITPARAKEKLLWSMIIYSLAAGLKKVSWYAFGKNSATLADAVAQKVMSSTFCLMTDLGRMDGTIGAPDRLFELQVLKALFPKSMWPLIVQLHRLTYNNKVTMKGIGGTFTFEQAFARASGDAGTSALNTIIAALISYHAYRKMGYGAREAWNMLGLYGGDDGISPGLTDAAFRAACHEMGFIPKTRMAVAPGRRKDAFCEGDTAGGLSIENCVDFLARFYGPGVWGGDPNSMSDVKRTLQNFCITALPSAENGGRFTNEQIAYSKAVSLYLCNRNTPILGELAVRVLRGNADIGPIPDVDGRNIEGILIESQLKYQVLQSGLGEDVQYINNQADWMWIIVQHQFGPVNWRYFDNWIADESLDWRTPPSIWHGQGGMSVNDVSMGGILYSGEMGRIMADNAATHGGPVMEVADADASNSDWWVYRNYKMVFALTTSGKSTLARLNPEMVCDADSGALAYARGLKHDEWKIFKHNPDFAAARHQELMDLIIENIGAKKLVVSPNLEVLAECIDLVGRDNILVFVPKHDRHEFYRRAYNRGTRKYAEDAVDKYDDWKLSWCQTADEMGVQLAMGGNLAGIERGDIRPKGYITSKVVIAMARDALLGKSMLLAPPAPASAVIEDTTTGSAWTTDSSSSSGWETLASVELDVYDDHEVEHEAMNILRLAEAGRAARKEKQAITAAVAAAATAAQATRIATAVAEAAPAAAVPETGAEEAVATAVDAPVDLGSDHIKAVVTAVAAANGGDVELAESIVSSATAPPVPESVERVIKARGYVGQRKAYYLDARELGKAKDYTSVVTGLGASRVYLSAGVTWGMARTAVGQKEFKRLKKEKNSIILVAVGTLVLCHTYTLAMAVDLAPAVESDDASQDADDGADLFI